MYTNLISLKVLDCSDFKMNLLLYKILPIWVGNYFFARMKILAVDTGPREVRELHEVWATG